MKLFISPLFISSFHYALKVDQKLQNYSAQMAQQ